MGAVYVVEQLSTGRKRALKLLLPSLLGSERSRERFEQEAKVASRIESDHVVEVVAAGVDGASGAPWIAMELLEGETLTERLARTGPMGAPEVLEVMKQLCHALGAAHAAGLVHRDIKPDNVYLATPRRDGVPFTVKILDFGIAKLTEDVRAQGGATGAVGSPLWMAPEQTSSTGVQPSADVWALGLVVFHCLTGRFYWREANRPEATLQGLLKEIVLDPLAPASVRAAELGVSALLPPAFDAWFGRAVVREPAQRFPEASACLAALHGVLSPLAPTLSFDPAGVSTLPSAGGAVAHGAASTLPSAGASVGYGPGSGPSAAQSVPAAFSATAPGPTASLPPPAPRRSRAALVIAGGLAVVLVGALGVVLVAAGVIGYQLTREDTASGVSSIIAPPSEGSSPAGAAPVATTEGATGGESKSASGTGRRASGAGAPAAPGSPTTTASTSPTTPAAPAPSAAPSSTVVVMSDVPSHPPRDYRLSWYRDKITQCWKGNEGAKPDAGSLSVVISVKLDDMGRTSVVTVNPRTHKFFAGCATVRTGEHPWGRGPPETKSFSFSF
jgi:tRNA A-37 threonylcarbamoyl transferase component Bud32